MNNYEDKYFDFIQPITDKVYDICDKIPVLGFILEFIYDFLTGLLGIPASLMDMFSDGTVSSSKVGLIVLAIINIAIMLFMASVILYILCYLFVKSITAFGRIIGIILECIGLPLLFSGHFKASLPYIIIGIIYISLWYLNKNGIINIRTPHFRKKNANNLQ